MSSCPIPTVLPDDPSWQFAGERNLPGPRRRDPLLSPSGLTRPSIVPNRPSRPDSRPDSRTEIEPEGCSPKFDSSFLRL
eukprot:901069-Rhodomonas_salina.1